MRIAVKWDKPLIEIESALSVSPSDLDDFYTSSPEYDKFNLFFVLLNSFHHALDEKAQEQAAHLSYLLAYYLFVPLTPPASCELSMYYIKQATALFPKEEYLNLLALIEKGN